MLARGMTVTEIAHAKGLSTNTIYAHRKSLMEKMGVSSLENLIKKTKRLGLDQP
jgi:DNA-binding NarL/FixJ family response regulator